MKYLDPFEIELEKSTLIEASAGTGKTYTITSLYCRLVAKGYPVESILVVTFTEAAAAELKIRIRGRLSDTLKQIEGLSEGGDDDLTGFLRKNNTRNTVNIRLRSALSSFDQASIMTIHSFCRKILNENAFESRALFDIELVPDRSRFVRQVCYDFFMNRINSLDPVYLSFLQQNQFTPDNLSAFFSNIAGRQDLSIVPEAPEFIDLSADYRDVLASIKEMLFSRQEEIINLITGNKGINKRSFSKKNLPSWIEKSCLKFETEGDNTFFIMKEKKDPLYNFTTTNIAAKTKDGFEPPEHEFFDLCEELSLIYQGFEQNLIRLKIDFLSFFCSELDKIKKEKGICFFDDLVNDLANALEGSEGGSLKQAVRQVYKACLIDEFQDTDSKQYKIFSNLFSVSGTPFFMVGDPKQAIYAFRGGDIFTYLKAAASCEQASTLKNNYRSSPLLVQGVNSIFSGREAPFLFDSITFSDVATPETSRDLLVDDQGSAKPLQFCFIERSNKEFRLDKGGFITKQDALQIIPSIVANDILSLFGSELQLLDKGDKTSKPGKITPGDVAVLVRTNDQANLIYTALSNLNIPSYLSRTGSVFDSDQALELYDILWAIQHPESKGYIKAALSTSVFGFTSDDMIRLDREETLFFEWQSQFSGYKKEWETKGFVSMIMSVFHSKDAFLNAGPMLDERAMTNFYHLVELISKAFLKDRISPYYLIKWYLNQLSEESREDTADQADELRLSTDKEAIAIVTVHKSKGLEYPVVYLPYLWEAPGDKARTVLFHDPERDDNLTLDLGSETIEKSKERFKYEEKAEQRRLLYVALTRASGMCRILWGGFKSVESSALGSLLHPCGCKDDSKMLEDFKHQRNLAPQSISLEKYQDKRSGTIYDEKTSVEQEKLVEQIIEKRVEPVWKMSSFSAIIRSSDSHTPGQDFLQPKEKADSDQAKLITLADFPKGAGTGDFFHAVFEDLDFTAEDKEVLKQVATASARFGILDNTQVGTAGQAVREVLQTSLFNGNHRFTLSSIKEEKRFNELEFAFPVNRFNKSLLINILKQHDPLLGSSEYIEQLTHLKTEVFSGFLKGFIDLVIVEKGKWYIIDYKTNYLGNKYQDYSQEALFQAMSEHHYFLQYYLYLIALHRYLGVRKKDYDYDKHFGGVFYLFIRGMHQGNTSDSGVYSHRPPKKCVQLLSDMLSE